MEVLGITPAVLISDVVKMWKEIFVLYLMHIQRKFNIVKWTIIMPLTWKYPERPGDFSHGPHESVALNPTVPLKGISERRTGSVGTFYALLLGHWNLNMP